MSQQMTASAPVKPVGAGLPLAVAAILLGTKWETPLAQLRPLPRIARH